MTHPSDLNLPPAVTDGIVFKRAIAFVIDLILVSLLVAIIIPLTALLALLVGPLLFAGIYIVYRWITLSGQSATLGMRLMGIETRTMAAHRLSSSEALRDAVGSLIVLTFAPLMIISAGFVIFSEHNRNMLDHLFGTITVNRLL